MVWCVIYVIWCMINDIIYDMIYVMMCEMVWYDIIYDIYLLAAVGLAPGGSSTVHIYTQTVHRTAQWNRIYATEHT
jgi:hypothetical protein